MLLRAGMIIRSPHWPKPVQVDRVEEIGGGYLHLIGHYLHTSEHVDNYLSPDDCAQITLEAQSTGFNASPRDLFLALEGRRYRYASAYDPLLAMNIAKVDPLPHQIEAVYGYILHQPRIRFLIADDPGAGKTIMAGLVLKELKLRGLARRILIVAPGHLRDQWRREMKERFEEKFTVIDRTTMRNHFGENVWEREPQALTSLDFARQDDVMPSLAAVHWDLVIVDEAHKMAAYRYGKKVEKTKRYRLGETLSRTSTHLLFLTATPHRGDPENFRLFLDLLQPGAFATAQMLERSIRDGDNPFFIRRLKEDLRDFQGRPLFLPRKVQTMTFNLGKDSPKEQQLYNDLSRYVERQYNKALAHNRRRNIAFALVILQRRMASSTYALYHSLKRRKARLIQILQEADAYRKGKLPQEIIPFDDVEEMSEEERWKQEELWETLSVAQNRAELEAEIETLKQLMHQAEAIIQTEDEVKLRYFRAAMQKLQEREPGEKVLVFTESLDTLRYLEKRLRHWGYTVCTIHGGMSLEERIDAERRFRNESQVMVATEAAGEGINLQFCHLMINYDIPWNPNRLEQRMGRIHRYGQSREVTIFNLVAADTREGRVLQRLFNKLEEIRKALGSDRVFDVIDELFPGRNLAQLLTEAAANARTLDDILHEIDVQVDENYLRRIRANLGESLATRHIDYTRIQEMQARAQEHRLIPEYTRAFFHKAWARLGGKIRPRPREKGFYTIEHVPSTLRTLAQAEPFHHYFGDLQRRYPLVTFDKALVRRQSRAEFIAFGHPLFEAILRWSEEHLTDALLRGATFLDPDGRRDGVLLFFEAKINDGTGATAGARLFALFAAGNEGPFEPLNPAILWDLAEAKTPAAPWEGLEALKKSAHHHLLAQLERYRHELKAERERQAKIKRKYGLTSLRHIILTLDREIGALQQRQAQGEDVALALRNKLQQREHYRHAMVELKQRIKQETHLLIGDIRFLTAIRILPDPTLEHSMVSSTEIEQRGMEIAFAYEREHGRLPEDVSTENLGYDIRSTDPLRDTVRYIEVKARAQEGSVALTQNEWFKAQRFGDRFYLYVIFHAADEEPILYIIRNPAATLEAEAHYEVRYLISAQKIRGAAQTYERTL